MPPIYLILILASLSRFSETVYLPSLNFIAEDFGIKISLVEFTSSIFFISVAISNIFWGIISDLFGKKKSIYIGMLIYTIGCIGCGLAENIQILSLSKLIQGIGTSCGIMIAQVMTREISDQLERTKIFAMLFSLIAFVPTIGPIVSNLANYYFNWRLNFLLMISVSIIALIMNISYKEVRKTNNNNFNKLILTAKQIMFDQKVWLIAITIGCCNGIVFSYFSEGTYYVVNLLNFKPHYHNLSYILMGLSAFFGGRLTNTLRTKEPYIVINKGIRISLYSMIVLLLIAALRTHNVLCDFTTSLGVVICMSGFVFSTGLIIPNCMSISLNKYSQNIGSATSLFGFMYYTVTSTVSLFMAVLRDDNIIIMPIYFLLIAFVMKIAVLRLKTSNDY